MLGAVVLLAVAFAAMVGLFALAALLLGAKTLPRE
jgi:hypothetical protein